MLSRRSVRVKVMQLLYSLDRDESLTTKEVVKVYTDNIDHSYELFLFSLYLMFRIAELSVSDAKKRKAKHLPNDYDKAFTDKLFENPLIQDIHNNKVLQKKWESLDFSKKVNDDYIQKIYDEFSKLPSYKEFITVDNDNAITLELLLEMFRFNRQNEYFNETMEDAYFNWVDDKSLVVGSVKKYFKSLPSENNNSFKDFFPEDETVKEFGLNLLKKTIKGKKKMMEHIVPVLENWDHERLAVVDTILLQMAMCEFFDFPTIPCKVTLNEYVELAKNYSTVKSKEFVNGILDKLMTQLTEEGKIVKEGRGLEE